MQDLRSVDKLAGSMNSSELRIASGLALGQRYPISAQGKVIGRGQTAEIRVPDVQAADNHAMVLAKDGRDFVYDLGTEGGTFVNGRRVDQSELLPGDVISIGGTQIEYLQLARAGASSGGVVSMPPMGGGALVPSHSSPANPVAMQAQLLMN